MKKEKEKQKKKDIKKDILLVLKLAVLIFIIEIFGFWMFLEIMRNLPINEGAIPH